MATFTLEELGKVVADTFQPTIVKMGEGGDLVLRPTVNLNDEETATMSRLQKEINSIQGGEERVYVNADGSTREPTDEETAEEEAEARQVRPRMIAILHDMIRTAAGDVGRPYADKFLELKGDDLGWLLGLVKEYGKAAQLGEASASPSS